MKKFKAMWAAALVVGMVGATGAALGQAERPLRVMGIVMKVEGKSLVVRPGFRATTQPGDEASWVTVAVDEKADIRIDGDVGKFEDLKAGMSVTAVTIPGAGQRPAKVVVQATTRGLSGVIVKVEGKNVIVRVNGPGGERKDVTVATDEKTQVRFLGVRVGDTIYAPKQGTLEDLKPEMRVRVMPETGTATRIFAMPLEAGRGSGR